MHYFIERTLSPDALNDVKFVLDRYMQLSGIEHGSEEEELAASILLILFDEGNTTVPDLMRAAAAHQWLGRDLRILNKIKEEARIR